ncbi:hypothetical protein [Actinomadura formosensis]|uniref:hypothetical protein n=1 Tax=Actinomadura formosensis TaxID=60706 RepID=UPI00082D5B68|nr:hypothetical protein [Actinomadura formosensis]
MSAGRRPAHVLAALLLLICSIATHLWISSRLGLVLLACWGALHVAAGVTAVHRLHRRAAGRGAETGRDEHGPPDR